MPRTDDLELPIRPLEPKRGPAIDARKAGSDHEEAEEHRRQIAEGFRSLAPLPGAQDVREALERVRKWCEHARHEFWDKHACVHDAIVIPERTSSVPLLFADITALAAIAQSDAQPVGWRDALEKADRIISEAKAALDKGIPVGEPVHPVSAKLTVAGVNILAVLNGRTAPPRPDASADVRLLQARIDKVENILSDMQAIRFGVSGKSLNEVNDWFSAGLVEAAELADRDASAYEATANSASDQDEKNEHRGKARVLQSLARKLRTLAADRTAP